MIYQNGVQDDTMETVLYSTGVVTREIEIDCFDGHELSGEIVADAVVEARPVLMIETMYEDIETTPIDLSPYAGTRQEFQIRITAGTITSQIIRAFRLRVGPPAVAVDSIVYNDSENEIYNDSEDLVYTEV